jgi:hypothetical protein
VSYCAYGELVKPDVSNIVLYCDRKTHVSFNWPIPGGALLVRVCKKHGDELERRAKEDPLHEVPGAQRPH